MQLPNAKNMGIITIANIDDRTERKGPVQVRITDPLVVANQPVEVEEAY